MSSSIHFGFYRKGGLIVTLKSLISMEFFLFFLRKFSQLHALLEPPSLLIFEKPASNSVFLCNKYKKIPKCLIRTSMFI